MIPKSRINQILFIQKYIEKKELFIIELIEKLDLRSTKKISNDGFYRWLDSWEAAADLDQDPSSARRIQRSLKQIKAGKTPHKSWAEFKESVGPC